MSSENTIRLHVSIGKGMHEKIELVRDLTGFATTQEAARYIMAKGIESMNTPIQATIMMRQLSAQYTPEEMLPLFEKLDPSNKKE